jgi:hypothetical protein
MHKTVFGDVETVIAFTNASYSIIMSMYVYTIEPAS